MLLLLGTLLAPAVATAVETPIPPPPTRWATDTVGLLPEGDRAALDARLEAYERSTGKQMLVWIGDTTGDAPTEDWTVRAFEKWKVGRKGIDDGLVIFVFSVDRKIRVEVGYGLEGEVPDAIASRVIRETIAPKFAEGQPAAGLAAGVDALVLAIEGKGPAAGDGSVSGGDGQGEGASGRAPPARRKTTFGEKIFLGLVGLVFLILFITNPRLAIFLLIQVLSSGRGGGGGGGGGGGWSGGGGRSGGGGATGSW